MYQKHLKILLIEDNLAEAELIEELLAEVIPSQFELNSVKRLGDGLEYLLKNRFDIILLDLSLPDSQGMDTLVQMKARSPTLPIIVLTALNDETVAIEAVRQGAQDYLVKGKFEGDLLVRAIRYAMERQCIEDKLRQQAERERLMGRMLEQIRSSLNLQEILETTVEEVRQLLKPDRVAIYQCQSHSSKKIVAESIDRDCLKFFQFSQQIYLDSQSIDSSNSPDRDGDSSSKDIIKAKLTVPIWQNEAIVENNLFAPLVESTKIPENPDSDRESSQSVRSIANEETQQFFERSPDCQLIKRDRISNKLWGELVALNYHESRQWEEWEIKFLQQLASQVAIAIQQSELYRKLHELATQDGLTKVANRRYFDRVLDLEWQRLAREEKPLSLILCDIDFFKVYNDYYGHTRGDSCLQKVAAAIKESAKRPADLVARYGGEEFAIILPDTPADGAIEVAQKVRDRIENLHIAHEKSSVARYVTLSLGVATNIPNCDRSPITLIEAADRALYRAKDKGRNQIYELR